METVVPRLRLDHASILVPGLPQAVAQLREGLGLLATPTPADAGRHSRVYLDRGYLEVAAREDLQGWTFASFFLRFDDPAAVRQHLDRVGLPYRFSRYTGADGVWDDVEIEAGDVPLPILVRRTDPPEIALSWPPPLRGAHPCGARTLAAVVVQVTDPAAAVDTYARLLGRPPVAGTGEFVAEFTPAAGHVVLIEGDRPGLVAVVLGMDTPGTSGSSRPRWQPGWQDPGATHGLWIGFVDRAGASPSITDQIGPLPRA